MDATNGHKRPQFPPRDGVRCPIGYPLPFHRVAPTWPCLVPCGLPAPPSLTAASPRRSVASRGTCHAIARASPGLLSYAALHIIAIPYQHRILVGRHPTGLTLPPHAIVCHSQCGHKRPQTATNDSMTYPLRHKRLNAVPHEAGAHPTQGGGIAGTSHPCGKPWHVAGRRSGSELTAY